MTFGIGGGFAEVQILKKVKLALSHELLIYFDKILHTHYCWHDLDREIAKSIPRDCKMTFNIGRGCAELQILISSHLSPLTLEVIGAPQMTLQQYLSILPCLPLPSGNLQTPFPSIPWCYLPICLPLLLAPFTVPCRIVFAMPEDLEMWPYHLSFRFFTMVRRSSCTPVVCWILLRTSSFVTWSL